MDSLKKAIIIIVKTALLSGILIGLASCLDSIGFDPEGNFNLNGSINTKDVSSAVLMLTNKSKTI
jgi:hypothetical protein